MSKKKTSSKEVTKKKQSRRKWTTFVRMCRYGIDNFSRNAWLTIAATAVMTITLLILFTAVVSRSVLTDTVAQLREKVDMSVYLKTETTEDQAQSIIDEMKQLSTVRSVTFISAESARQAIAEENKNDLEYLEALKEATNKNPAVLRVVVKDINDTSELSGYVDSSETLKPHLDPNRDPSFAGSRKAAIENIGNAIGFAEKAGIGAGILFIAISSLIIFNTIRMAIFNRKEEIQMMKLIGADQSFIRGPFIVEAIMYGFFAALIATAIGFGVLFTTEPALSNYLTVQPTLDFVTIYIGLVLLAMIVAGAIIGILSSLLATRRYLKI